MDKELDKQQDYKNKIAILFKEIPKENTSEYLEYRRKPDNKIPQLEYYRDLLRESEKNSNILDKSQSKLFDKMMKLSQGSPDASKMILGNTEAYSTYKEKIKELDRSLSLHELTQKEYNKQLNAAKGELLKTADAAKIGGSELEELRKEYVAFNKVEQVEKQDKKDLGKTNKANNIKAETSVRLLEIERQRQAVTFAERESELEIQKSRIDLMEKGSLKELSLLRHSHESRLFEIEKAGKEMLKAQQDIERKDFETKNPTWKEKGLSFSVSTKTVDQLPQKQVKYLNDMKALAKLELDKSVTDYYKDELDAYMTYAERRLKIQEEYKKLREDAEAAGRKDRIVIINREENESLKEVDKLFGEREKSFKVWADSIVNLSLNQLGILLEQAQQQLTVARMKAGTGGKLGENEDIARYRAQIIELQNRIKEITINTGKGATTSFRDWRKVYEVLGSVNEELNEIGENIGGATGEIIGMASKVTTSTLSMISGITTLSNWSVEATKMAAEGASKAIIAVERASVILAVISAAIQVISQIVNAFDGLKDAERDHEEYMKLLISLQEEYNNKLVETILLQDDTWGTDEIGNMINAIDALSQATDNYNNKLSEQQKAWKDPTGNFWKKLFKYGTIMGWAGLKPGQLMGVEEKDGGKADLRNNLRYVTKKASNGFLGIGGNHTKTMNLEDWVRSNLKNPDGSPAELFYKDGRLNMEVAMSLTENNSDRLTGQTKESLDALIELEKNIRAAEEAMRGYISDTFGSLGDGLSDAIVDAFQNGTDAAKTFRDNVTAVLEDVGRQMVRNLFVQKAVEQYEKDLEKVYKNYAEDKDEKKFSEELAKATEGFFNGAMTSIEQGNKFLEMYDEEMKKRGFDTYKPEGIDRNATQKGIAAMSQDSADQLNGSFAALLIYADKTYTGVTNINTFLASGLSVLNRIEENTRYCRKLEAIEMYIKRMQEGINSINDKGIYLRK